MNILKADIFHFMKDKMTYILTIIIFALPLFTCLMYNMSGGETFSAETILFKGLGTDIFCVLVGFGLSLFLGKDYSNNTIRNKICYGESRFKITGCIFLESILITLYFVLVNIVSSLIFGSIFGTLSFGTDFFLKLFSQIMILFSFSTLVSAIIVSSKSMKVGITVTLIISVILNSISYLLPVLAIDNGVARIACRTLYMVVSSMLLSSTNGTYLVRNQYAFEGLFANSIILALVYIIISVGITCLIVRKQEYK